MKTRSQTKKQQTKEEDEKEKQVMYEVNIDFDDASACWRQNKKSIGNGSYKYICIISKKSGSICGNNCYKGRDCCWAHRKSVK